MQNQKKVIGDGEDDKNYNRVQTARQEWGYGCGWGQYSWDGVVMGTMVVDMGWGWVPNILLCSYLLTPPPF